MEKIPVSIVEGIKNGSYADFDALYERVNGKLYNFVMRISNGNSYMAEEVVQCSFIKLWESRETLETDKNIITYLCAIARNQLLNHYQHQTVKWVYEEFVLSNQYESSNQTEQDIDSRFLEEYIDELIEQLPPARKRIFVMSRKEGKSNREISEELNIAEKTVEAQMTKALAVMKKSLAKYITIILCFIQMTIRVFSF